MRYSLLAGGKRIRPVLALATARALDREAESVLPLAAAIELIHTYSLIHDDLPAMDDDDLRRGQPTCHKAYGEDVAILAGDGLYAEAFGLLLSSQDGEPAAVLAAARRLALATGVRGMVGGQYIDVARTAPQSADGLRQPARTQDRPIDRRQRRVRIATWRAAQTCHNLCLQLLCERARRAVPDRRRHPRRDRIRRHTGQAAGK